MKKMILFLCVIMMYTSCRDPFPWSKDYTARLWYVYNATEQTLILKCPYPGEGEGISFYPILPENIEYKEFKIAPQSRTLETADGLSVESLCKGMIPRDSEPLFDYYFAQSAIALGEEVSWQILSEDGEVLRTWSYSNKDMPDERFFKKSEWKEVASGFWQHAFLFFIQPEDIQTVTHQ